MAKRIDKKEFVKRVAKRLSITNQEAEKAIDASLDTIYEALKEGETVTLVNLAVFILTIAKLELCLSLILVNGYVLFSVGHQPIPEMFSLNLPFKRNLAIKLLLSVLKSLFMNSKNSSDEYCNIAR
jgi:hypothetical protein